MIPKAKSVISYPTIIKIKVYKTRKAEKSRFQPFDYVVLKNITRF